MSTRVPDDFLSKLFDASPPDNGEKTASAGSPMETLIADTILALSSEEEEEKTAAKGDLPPFIQEKKDEKKDEKKSKDDEDDGHRPPPKKGDDEDGDGKSEKRASDIDSDVVQAALQIYLGAPTEDERTKLAAARRLEMQDAVNHVDTEKLAQQRVGGVVMAAAFQDEVEKIGAAIAGGISLAQYFEENPLQ